MTDFLAPFLLLPSYKDYLWGGNRLASLFGKKGGPERIAESWELSAHPDGESVIAAGPFRGQTLSAFLESNPGAAGTAVPPGKEFPLLVKLIDAAQNLSVQVHPDEDYARRNEGSRGKTEMWYILRSDPGAFLCCGFSRPVTGGEVERRIREGTLADVLRSVPVKPGDVFFIPAGTIHAVGEGIVLAEVQESSNITYRVFDYGRAGADGRPRPLHIGKALDVLRMEEGFPPPPGGEGEYRPVPGGKARLLCSCPSFTCSVLELNGRLSKTMGNESFLSLLCLEGKALLSAPGGGLGIGTGDSVFVPAGRRDILLEGTGEFLLTFPGRPE
ncbi:MAG: class I mannose-6-phosphate isomerase [Aminivibrio sp.]|nr:class I mannose-6-phosphate isomerase [Aminivibrio sp.]